MKVSVVVIIHNKSVTIWVGKIGKIWMDCVKMWDFSKYLQFEKVLRQVTVIVIVRFNIPLNTENPVFPIKRLAGIRNQI